MMYLINPGKVEATAIDDKPIIDAATGKQMIICFQDFILGRLLDKTFGENMATILSAVAIKNAVKDPNALYYEIESADYAKLLQATKSPAEGYSPMYAMATVAFMNAIVSATETKPAELPCLPATN